MTSISPLFRRATALSLALAAPAIAQQTRTIPGLDNFSLQPSRPIATPTPTPSATPVPLPPAPRVIVPVATPTPITSPSPIPTPNLSPPPRPRAAPAARTTPIPVPTATTAATVPDALSSPAPTPIPSSTPMPSAAPLAPVAPARNGDATPWLIGGGVLAIALALGAWRLLRRRERPDDEAPSVEPLAQPVPEPLAEPVAEPIADPVTRPRGRIAIALRPAKAGVNLLSATVECEIVLSNTGDAPAEDIRLDVRLLSAHAGQDAELAAIQAQPVDRPAVPVFALAAGEERRVRSVAALPRDAIRSMTAGGRPMFVPLIAITVAYDAGRTSQAFAIGVQRIDSAKLAPFWLDGPPRTFDTVAARPHAAAVER